MAKEGGRKDVPDIKEVGLVPPDFDEQAWLTENRPEDAWEQALDQEFEEKNAPAVEPVTTLQEGKTEPVRANSGDLSHALGRAINYLRHMGGKPKTPEAPAPNLRDSLAAIGQDMARYDKASHSFTGLAEAEATINKLVAETMTFIDALGRESDASLKEDLINELGQKLADFHDSIRVEHTPSEHLQAVANLEVLLAKLTQRIGPEGYLPRVESRATRGKIRPGSTSPLGTAVGILGDDEFRSPATGQVGGYGKAREKYEQHFATEPPDITDVTRALTYTEGVDLDDVKEKRKGIVQNASNLGPVDIIGVGQNMAANPELRQRLASAGNQNLMPNRNLPRVSSGDLAAYEASKARWAAQRKAERSSGQDETGEKAVG